MTGRMARQWLSSASGRPPTRAAFGPRTRTTSSSPTRRSSSPTGWAVTRPARSPARSPSTASGNDSTAIAASGDSDRTGRHPPDRERVRPHDRQCEHRHLPRRDRQPVPARHGHDGHGHRRDRRSAGGARRTRTSATGTTPTLRATPRRRRRATSPRSSPSCPRRRSCSPTSATRAPTCSATTVCGASPSITATCRNWSPPVTSTRRRPASIRAATSSPAPSASNPMCASTGGPCPSSVATGSCCAATVWSTRWPTPTSPRSCSTTSDPQSAADALVDAANAAGGRDNITVIVVDVLDGDDPPDPTLEIDVVPTWADSATRPTPAGTFALDPDAPVRREPGPLERTAAAGDADARSQARRASSSSPSASPRPPPSSSLCVVFSAWARGGYYVAFNSDDEAIVYRGRDGGVLWIDPTAQTTRWPDARPTRTRPRRRDRRPCPVRLRTGGRRLHPRQRDDHHDHHHDDIDHHHDDVAADHDRPERGRSIRTRRSERHRGRGRTDRGHDHQRAMTVADEFAAGRDRAVLPVRPTSAQHRTHAAGDGGAHHRRRLHDHRARHERRDPAGHRLLRRDPHGPAAVRAHRRAPRRPRRRRHDAPPRRAAPRHRVRDDHPSRRSPRRPPGRRGASWRSACSSPRCCSSNEPPTSPDTGGCSSSPAPGC